MRTPTPEALEQARRYSGYIQIVRWEYCSDRLDMMLHDLYYMLKPEIRFALEWLCHEGEID